MIIKITKLRRLTITTQLIAGIALLTASYLSTDKDWANDFLEAAIPAPQTTTINALANLKVRDNCKS